MIAAGRAPFVTDRGRSPRRGSSVRAPSRRLRLIAPPKRASIGDATTAGGCRPPSCAFGVARILGTAVIIDALRGSFGVFVDTSLSEDRLSPWRGRPAHIDPEGERFRVSSRGYGAAHGDRRGGVLGREACPSVLADRVLRPAPNGSSSRRVSRSDGPSTSGSCASGSSPAHSSGGPSGRRSGFVGFMSLRDLGLPLVSAETPVEEEAT
jgi:hypothetical protein